MVLYHVSWFYNNDLAKGKGRPKKNEYVLAFSVLCRNASDALSCLTYHFNSYYPNPDMTIEDGEVVLKRVKIDSRGFNANYLFMDGIREPIELNNLKSNNTRLTRIF